MTLPFENDTSKIIKKLSKRGVVSNKLRNIVGVLSIVLTATLFTSVTTLCVGATQSIKLAMSQMRGSGLSAPVSELTVNISVMLAATFFIGVFIITGYLLIHNVFDISIVQDIKKYGLLRTLGATEKQIKRIVHKQAVWLSAIGIPIGLLIGYLVGKFVLPVVLEFMKGEYQNLTALVSISPIIFIFSGVFSVFTIWLSIQKPAKMAATMSPVDAIRYSEKNIQKHSPNLFKKNRVIEMAEANLHRNPKRSFSIIVSFVFCVVLLNSAFVIGNSVDVNKYLQSVISSDFVVATPHTFSNVQGFKYKEDGLDPKVIREIEQTLPVTNAGYIYKNTLDDTNITYDYGNTVIEVQEGTSKDGRINKYGTVQERTYPIIVGQDNRAIGNIYGVNSNIISKMNIVDGETDKNILAGKLDTKDYIIEVSAINSGGNAEFICPVNQEVSIYKDGQLYKTVTVIAHAVVNYSLAEAPGKNTGYISVGGDCPLFYMNDELFSELYDAPSLLNFYFDIDDAHFSEATHYLSSLDGVQFASVETLGATMNGLRQTIFVLGGLIGFLIAGIGIVNFINIMITGIISRQREFATLESLGMTKKQLYKLVLLEGIAYTIVAAILGIPITYLVSKVIIPSLFSQPDFWIFTIIPVIYPALIVILIIFMLSIFVPPISFRCLGHTSIVERMRMIE